MKKNIGIIACIYSLLILSGCNNESGTKENNSTSNPSSTIKEKDEVAKMGDEGIKNAGKAKAPKGTITFRIDGQTYSATENTVQCMFVGMGSKDYAQGIISGNGEGFSFAGVMMGKPGVGKFLSKKITDPTGLQLTLNGVQYNGSGAVGGEAIVNVTKVNADGNNLYIGGTFSGKFKSKDGKEIIITDGEFASAYL